MIRTCPGDNGTEGPARSGSHIRAGNVNGAAHTVVCSCHVAQSCVAGTAQTIGIVRRTKFRALGGPGETPQAIRLALPETGAPVRST